MQGGEGRQFTLQSSQGHILQQQQLLAAGQASPILPNWKVKARLLALGDIQLQRRLSSHQGLAWHVGHKATNILAGAGW